MHLDNSLINKNTRNEYLRDIFILVFIALAIGIYLIATTVVVSKDSIAYLARAQWLQDDPAKILAERPSGYELLILTSYRIFYAFTGNTSVQGWIWAAQSLTLSCRILTIITLYLIGCLICHRRNSFWGCVILLLLPEPAQWGSDVLREWPYLLFMSLSLLSLLYGILKNRIWLLGLTGLFAGIGYLIRLESIQLVLIGLFALLLQMLRPPKHSTRFKILIGGILLAVCSAAPVLVYAGSSGQITTDYLKQYIEKIHVVLGISEPNELVTSSINEPNTATDISGNVDDQPPPEENTQISEEPASQVEYIRGDSLPQFAYELFKDTGELLMWFYLPFWIIGIYVRLRDKTDPMVRNIIGALIITGIGMLLMRYFSQEAIITQRWVLPLVAVTVFLIHSGIEKFGDLIERKKSPHLQNPKKWSRVLVSIGILLCLMKVFEPLGAGKKSYRQAAEWVKVNTHEIDWLYAHDRRIPFYAERGFIEYLDHQDGFDLEPYGAKLLVVPSNNERTPNNQPEGLTLETSFGTKEGTKEMFYIYRYEINR